MRKKDNVQILALYRYLERMEGIIQEQNFSSGFVLLLH